MDSKPSAKDMVTTPFLQYKYSVQWKGNISRCYIFKAFWRYILCINIKSGLRLVTERLCMDGRNIKQNTSNFGKQDKTKCNTKSTELYLKKYLIAVPLFSV